MKPSSSEREAFRLIEEMLQLMEERGLVELEVEQQGLRIRLKKAGGAPAVQAVEYAPAPHARHAAPAAAGSSPMAMDEGSGKTLIKSPMVGTFYRSPAPDAPPFMEPGQDIEVGQVVCIIEAMKLMNEIKAEVAGRLTDILVQNGDPVEYGQPLFALEPR